MCGIAGIISRGCTEDLTGRLQSNINTISSEFNIKINTLNVSSPPRDWFGMLEMLTWYSDQPLNSFADIALYLLVKRADELGVKILLNC